MLSEIRIQDFAIIDQLSLSFGEGLIIFTGETGAGKSIIIDAVGTLLGSRADTSMVRSGAEFALVEGVFRIPENVKPQIHEILRNEDLLDEDDELVLGREIRLQGRSIARVNGRTVNLKILRELGEYLVDVHGQTEHLSLLRVRHHLELIDRFAGNEKVFMEYKQIYRRLKAVRGELDSLRQTEREAARRVDLLSYQIDEIEKARLDSEEESALRQERDRLANAESLAKLTQEALQLLDEDDPETASAMDLIGQVTTTLGNLARLDTSQSALNEKAQALTDGLGDLIGELRSYVETVEFNPKRLNWVDDRLDLIFNLKRKYGDSIEEVLAFCEKSRGELDAITHAEERIAELEQEEHQILKDLVIKGEILSRTRQKAADRLAQAIDKELDELRMDQAKFAVDIQRRIDPQGVIQENGERIGFDARGFDLVEFLVAPNPGEGFKPLVKIASGGETSRLMLALKNVLARADQTPTLIFDEIDQGIGGRVGTVVGQKLWTLARAHQVMCITHLPQLAAYGEQHYRVEKAVLSGRTRTQVDALSGKKRVDELALMMGEVSAGTRQSAQDILRVARQTTV